jgi:hypothetical protein
MGCEPEGYLALVGKGRFRRLLRSGAAEGDIGRMECRLIRRVEAEGELGGAEGDGGRTTVITREEGDSSLSVLTNLKGPAGTVFKSPYLLTSCGVVLRVWPIALMSQATLASASSCTCGWESRSFMLRGQYRVCTALMSRRDEKVHRYWFLLDKILKSPIIYKWWL